MSYKALLLTPLASPFLEQPFKKLQHMDPSVTVFPVFYGDGGHRPSWGALNWSGKQLQGNWKNRRKELDKIWAEIQPDMLIVSQYRSRECRYVRKKALQNNVPFYMLFVERFIPSGLLKNQIKRFLFKKFTKEARGLGVMGKTAHLEYADLYKGPIIDCPYTFDFSKLLSFDDSDRPTDKTVFLYSGRLVNFRDPLGTVKVFAELYKRNPGKVELIISGRGELEDEVKDLVNNLNINEAVRYMNSFTDWEDIRNLYRHGHVLLSLGAYSTWNITIYEAMAAGMAVIATRTTEAANTLILDGYNGFLVDHNQIDSTLKAMEEVLKIQDRWKIFGMRSRDLVKTFSCEKVTENVHSLLLEMCKRKAKKN